MHTFFVSIAALKRRAEPTSRTTTSSRHRPGPAPIGLPLLVIERLRRDSAIPGAQLRPSLILPLQAVQDIARRHLDHSAGRADSTTALLDKATDRLERLAVSLRNL